MKNLSSGKLRAIIALQLAVISLIAGLFIVRPWQNNPASGQPDPPAPPTHSKVRTAEISLNPNLSWELSLLGSETEDAVAAFIKNEHLYIFGNTHSSDLDFDRAGIFLAIVDVYGLTKGFFIYGLQGESVRSVTLCEGGFLLAVESPISPKLYVVDFSGSIKKEISGFLTAFERVIEVKYYGGGYLLFTSPANDTIGISGLRCSFFSLSLDFLISRLAVSPYSLKLYEIVVISGRAVAVCNAVSTMHTLPAIVEFAQTESPKILTFPQYPGEVKGLSIYQGEFLLLTAMEGSSLLHIGLDYTAKSRTFLSQLSSLSISDVGSNGQTYVVFVDTAVLLVNGKGERKSTLSPFVPSTMSGGKAYAGGIVIYAGRGGVAAFSDQKVVFTAAVLQGGTDSLLAIDENNLFYIYHFEGDIKIAKLRTLY